MLLLIIIVIVVLAMLIAKKLKTSKNVVIDNKEEVATITDYGCVDSCIHRLSTALDISACDALVLHDSIISGSFNYSSYVYSHNLSTYQTIALYRYISVHSIKPKHHTVQRTIAKHSPLYMDTMLPIYDDAYDEYAQLQDSAYDKHYIIRKYDYVVDKHDLKDIRNCTSKRSHSATYKVDKINRYACAAHKRIDRAYAMFN
jgi:hypothetical protein